MRAALSRPNFLFLFTDDQRHDTIRALGNGQIHTPNIDWLVENGTAFENTYIMGGTNSAVCMPSRAMLMTGRTLFHLEDEGRHIPNGHVMLGEALESAGYECWGAGKWHNGPASYARSFNHGSDIYFGGMYDHWGVPVHEFDPTGKYESRITRTAYYLPSNVVEEKIADHVHGGTHSSELFAGQAAEFIDDYTADSPFFAYVAFMAPHDPRTMPQEFLDMYDPDGIEVPASFMPQHPFDNGELDVRDELLAGFPRSEREVRHHVAEYYAMITHVDAQIGNVIESLRKSGRLDETVIVFASDNGLAVGRHGLMGKQNLYDHSIHVPLVMAGPSISRGGRVQSLAYTVDIYLILCEIAGVEISGSVLGNSLLPTIQDQSIQIRDYLYFAYKDLMRSIQVDQWKLIEYSVAGERHTQLFDLDSDPMETNDLSGVQAHLGRLRGLRDKLASAREEFGDHISPFGSFWQGF